MVTSNMTPTPPRHALTDHGLFATIAKIALRNSNRFIKLQTPHFANRSESHTCKLPGGIGPNSLQTVRMISRRLIAPSIRGRVRMIRDSASHTTKRSGAAVSPQPGHNGAPPRGAQKYAARQIASSPSQRFSGLRGGPHCILSCFLGVVASCTASRTQLLGSPLFLSPADCSAGTGAGSTLSPRDKRLNFRALGFCGANFTNEG
jgi:hypothetical protein